MGHLFVPCSSLRRVSQVINIGGIPLRPASEPKCYQSDPCSSTPLYGCLRVRNSSLVRFKSTYCGLFNAGVTSRLSISLTSRTRCIKGSIDRLTICRMGAHNSLFRSLLGSSQPHTRVSQFSFCFTSTSQTCCLWNQE